MTTTNEKTHADLWEWIKTVHNSEGPRYSMGTSCTNGASPLDSTATSSTATSKIRRPSRCLMTMMVKGTPALMLFARLATALENVLG